jgi:hypothetical protein
VNAESPHEKGAPKTTGADVTSDGTAPRPRRTKVEMEALRSALYEIVERNKPCSVRQAYYVGIGRLWEKDTGGSRRSYDDVIRNLGVMRESGQLPWGWLTDSGRYVRIPQMYESMTDALDRMQETYRRNLWATQPRHVEVWAESDSTSALIESVTRSQGVGLFSCKGQAGKEFAHSAAMTYLEIGKPITVLYVGDWDPSGLGIPRSLEERLSRYAGGRVPIEFRRIAVTPEQIAEHQLQTHDVNTKDRSYQRFAEECRLIGLAEQAVEVEAFSPPVLRQILWDHLDALAEDIDAWNAMFDVQASERELLQEMAEEGWSV